MVKLVALQHQTTIELKPNLALIPFSILRNPVTIDFIQLILHEAKKKKKLDAATSWDGGLKSRL